MWKILSIITLALLFTSLNGLPVESEPDEIINSEIQGIPTLATELLPPLENAEVTDYKIYKSHTNKRTISTELEPPKRVVSASFRDEDYSKPVLSTELEPPKEDIEKSFNSEDKENEAFRAIFIINFYAVKNSSGEDTGEILSDEVAEKYPEMLEPMATVLLVLEEDDENKPLDLDELAKNLEEEGIKVKKISEDGETKVIQVDFDKSIEDNDVELIKPGKFNKVRRRRTICSTCQGGGLLSKLLNKHRGGGGGGGCQGNCGGGGYPQPTQTVGVIPVVVVPVQQGPQYQRPHRPHYQPQPHYQPAPQPHYQPAPQPHYQPAPQPHYQPAPQPHYQPQPHYVQPQPVYQQPSGGCNTCGGGNHGSYSQASAQASAQSSSNSW